MSAYYLITYIAPTIKVCSRNNFLLSFSRLLNENPVQRLGATGAGEVILQLRDSLRVQTT